MLRVFTYRRIVYGNLLGLFGDIHFIRLLSVEEVSVLSMLSYAPSVVLIGSKLTTKHEQSPTLLGTHSDFPKDRPIS